MKAREISILCVGNSFAVDVATYVHQIGIASGHPIDISVLYIPGCPINRHYKNIMTGDQEYEFYHNGERYPFWKEDTIFRGLEEKRYDFITFQQRSGDSVDGKTFFPELPLLLDKIKEKSESTFILHRTWAYAKTFSHERYGSDPLDQERMHEDIVNAYQKVSEAVAIPYIIPTGSAIQKAREIFGDALTRDGYHLNERGRTLAGILWVIYFGGDPDLDLTDFAPSGDTYDPPEPPVSKAEIQILKEIAKETYLENKGHNLSH